MSSVKSIIEEIIETQGGTPDHWTNLITLINSKSEE